MSNQNEILNVNVNVIENENKNENELSCNKRNVHINKSNQNKHSLSNLSLIDIDDPHIPSICIPRVDLWVTNDYIEKIMNEVLLPDETYLTTCIERIDLINRQNEKGEDYKRVFVHFKPWDSFNCDSSIKMRKKLLGGEIVKIMHNSPSYWKCSASRVPRPEWNEPSPPIEKQRKKAYLFDDSSSTSNNESSADDDIKPIKVKSNYQNKSIKQKPSQKQEQPKWLGEKVFETLNNQINNESNKEENKQKKSGFYKKNQKKTYPHPSGKPPAGKIWDSMSGTWVNANSHKE